MSNQLMSQEEIDALMNGQGIIEPAGESGGTPAAASQTNQLTVEEIDILGEIGNISMGSAATTLSELLNQKVTITSPKVREITKQELFNSFIVPFMVIKVDFSEGINGYNILILNTHDAMVMANLMMGGDGSAIAEEMSEIEISAASEAMNMMIGTASTSLSQVFNRTVNISPPSSELFKNTESSDRNAPEAIEENIVVTSFRMTIGELVDTTLMQVMGIQTAKEEAALLLQDLNDMAGLVSAPEASAQTTAEPEVAAALAGAMEDETMSSAAAEVISHPALKAATDLATTPLSKIEQRNLDLILDIPLKVTVLLGRTKRPIKEVLSMVPGSVLELDALADEPVEILVNGKLVAMGEVVVANENFGVKITNIISPIERIQRLGK